MSRQATPEKGRSSNWQKADRGNAGVFCVCGRSFFFGLPSLLLKTDAFAPYQFAKLPE